MTTITISIFISYANVDNTFVDRKQADLHQRGQWSSWLWTDLCLLWQEVWHA